MRPNDRYVKIWWIKMVCMTGQGGRLFEAGRLWNFHRFQHVYYVYFVTKQWMLVTKREEVTEQGFCKILWRKLRPRGILLLVFIQFQFQSHCHSSGWGGGWALIWVWLGGGGGGVWGWGWALIRRWALIRDWALIPINTVVLKLSGRVGLIFSSFNPCPSFPSAATDDRKQFQWLNMVLKNKTGTLFLKLN